MFKSESFARSRQLLNHAFSVLQKNKKLMIFPALSLFGGFFLLLVFFAPSLLESTGFSWSRSEHWTELSRRLREAVPLSGIWPYVPLAPLFFARFAAFFVAAMFATTFVNVAFYHEIMRAMAGDQASLRRGLIFATGRVRPIIAWTLFASSVGLLLQLLAGRLGALGRLVLLLIGMSWSVASTFAIPVLIREDTANPLSVLRASASTIRKTWGESINGFLGIPSGIGLFAIVLLPLFRVTHGMFTSSLLILIAAISVAFIIWVTMVNAARSIYRCALYVYATEGVLPEPYSAELLDSAWSVKKRL